MGHLNATNDEAATIGCCHPDTGCCALTAGLYATAKAPGQHHLVATRSTDVLLLADSVSSVRSLVKTVRLAEVPSQTIRPYIRAPRASAVPQNSASPASCMHRGCLIVRTPGAAPQEHSAAHIRVLPSPRDSLHGRAVSARHLSRRVSAKSRPCRRRGRAASVVLAAQLPPSFPRVSSHGLLLENVLCPLPHCKVNAAQHS